MADRKKGVAAVAHIPRTRDIDPSDEGLRLDQVNRVEEDCVAT